MQKTIGILGGMGPYATLDLFHKIILNTPAQIDQDHLQIIIYNNPKIPPRIQDVNQSSTSPLPELIKSAITLEQAGADFIIMPCHTAHIWINEVKKAINIPFYSMIKNTVQATIREYESLVKKKILLLATETTINTRLYQSAFENSPFETIIPDEKEQEVVDNAIKNVKGGKLKNNQYIYELNQIINHYNEKGISMLIGCCTEVPLMFPYFNRVMKMIDPTLMLAIMAIKKME
ncbi:aspartate/glutamate racemase family protein [Bacillus sp. ISL-78]|uniref:aspartate/glutamate racemase family protein n=1 Tax=Bacillus sp. ISL-78 TaxID=2819139 RepID=UPI001BE50675|nr:amino acid racemase [Bacillus sp. ISL-78]MBT2618649.1 amino acid racemase [Bacillus sp. ISL-78]